ncbi:LysR substrate-binding domain-containing protein [Actinocrispum sp. NPDC049592]|uniref:LysR family transcriptional regulator n=1 Tax=Actinocrispum sp. NPDC049592 TaxID=3154835 RepID=UPI00342F257E
MDLVWHLRCFLVLVDELHFGRAATRLHMAQPSLSQRIRRLEQQYGVQLFDRSAGRVRLTAAGEVLAGEARDIVARVDTAAVLVRGVGTGHTGELHAGIPPETPSRVLAALIASFAEHAPHVRLDLRAATTAEQLSLLQHGDLDVGVLQHPVDADGLIWGPVLSLPQGVVLPRRSPLADRGEVMLADLAGHELVLFPRDAAPGLYDHTLATCRLHGFRPTEVRHAASMELMLGLVASGQTVAFDQGAVAQKEPRVIWRPLSGRPLVWQVSTAWPRRTPHQAAQRFADVVARVLTTAEPVPTEAEQTGTPRPWTVVFAQRPPETPLPGI